MAITSNCCKFLFYCKTLGADYAQTLTLGRLNLYATRKDIDGCIKLFRNNEKTIAEVDFPDEYCEPLLHILGAKRADSLDFSNYENPTVIHDLNEPVPDELTGKYSVVIDGGTIEHVFNFPTAIKNCMIMLKEGGHYIGITPANNLMGHGFYQFSPELYYNIFDKENGFHFVKMIICTQNGNGVFSDWYEVISPREAKSRVVLTNAVPAYLMVLARKTATENIFNKNPQQSDYKAIWAGNKALRENRPAENESKIRFLYRKLTPRPVKAVLHKMYNLFARQKIVEEGLGEISPGQFRKMNF